MIAQLQGGQSASASSYAFFPAAASAPAPGDYEARFLALEEKLATKDAIIIQLGEKLNQNMQDYADQVNFQCLSALTSS